MSYPTWEPNYASEISWEIAYDSLDHVGKYGIIETHPTGRMRVIIEGEQHRVIELLGGTEIAKSAGRETRSDTTNEYDSTGHSPAA